MTKAAALALSLIAALTGCQAGSSPRHASEEPPSAVVHATGQASPHPPRTPEHAPAGRISKVLVFVVENHSLDQMRQGMPAVFALAEEYGYATRYRAVAHPSLPNYLAMIGGSTFGVTDDAGPEVHRIAGPSVFGQATAAGRSATVYVEDLPSPCAPENTGSYAVRHNPWVYFVDERAECLRHEVPLDRLAGDAQHGDLPEAGLVIPNVCSDAHDCPLSTADAWIARYVDVAMAGPDWAAGRLLIVVTADEDDHDQDNAVLTTVLHPSLHHVVAGLALTHFSLAGLYDEVLGLAPLRQAQTAPSLLGAFGLAGQRG